MVVRLTISLLPEDSRPALTIKFYGFDMNRQELKEWCNGQTMFLASQKKRVKGMKNYSHENNNKIEQKGVVHKSKAKKHLELSKIKCKNSTWPTYRHKIRQDRKGGMLVMWLP